MIFRQSTLRWIFAALIALAMIGALVSCGDPKSQAPAITVTFASQPPASLNTGSTIGIEALVANDPQNKGVSFSCTPDTTAGECGTFNPPSAGSNVPTCYQAPATVPDGDTVTVIATSVTDPTVSITATISIQAGAPSSGCTP